MSAAGVSPRILEKCGDEGSSTSNLMLTDFSSNISFLKERQLLSHRILTLVKLYYPRPLLPFLSFESSNVTAENTQVDGIFNFVFTVIGSPRRLPGSLAPIRVIF